ncbi:unnamed protein product [Trichobilharzia regenti]|nr:unnamed protein product [Trichobilharzia regenti]
MNRLANMHNNCFFTNLLLTDIFAALASYPCPLLYEFLLNPVGLSVKPSVNTLYKVSVDCLPLCVCVCMRISTLMFVHFCLDNEFFKDLTEFLH